MSGWACFRKWRLHRLDPSLDLSLYPLFVSACPDPAQDGIVDYCCMSEASFNGYAPEPCLKWSCQSSRDADADAQPSAKRLRLRCDIGPRNANSSSLEHDHIAPGSSVDLQQLATLLNNTVSASGKPVLFFFSPLSIDRYSLSLSLDLQVLIFGGDSTAKQRYCALSCALGRFGFTATKFEIRTGHTGGLRHAGACSSVDRLV